MAITTHDGTAFFTLSDKLLVAVFALKMKSPYERNRICKIHPMALGTGLTVVSSKIDAILTIIMMTPGTLNDAPMLSMGKLNQWSLVRSEFLMLKLDNFLLGKTGRDNKESENKNQRNF